MKYEIRIEHSPEPSGTIELQRLAMLAESMMKISEGALQIRLRGVSLTKGRKKTSLKSALKVSLSGLKKGSTILFIESEKFEKTLMPYQADLFRQEVQRDLQGQTPVSLFISAFQDAFRSGSEHELLDKPLLKELKQFKKVFLSNDEVIVFSNQGAVLN